MILGTILLFIALLAVLILIHEWGHFFAARRAGIRVDEFGLGFPPKAYSVKKGEVEYSVNWLPLGGFVKIHGEDGEDKTDPRSFGAKSIGVRMVVVLAGVTMNFLLAIALLSFGFWYGLPQVVDKNTTHAVRDVKVTVLQIIPGSPAETAGIQIGDAVSKITVSGVETEILEVKALQDVIAAHKGEELTVLVNRGKTRLQMRVTPRAETPPDQGPLGIVIEKTGIVSYPWYRAPIEGVKAAFSLSWFFITTFSEIIWNLILHGKLIAEIAGPVGIGALTHQVTQLGFSYLIQFAAVISLNLAIINALPIPALDGGRFLFLAIEGIKGSPVSQRYEKIAHVTGFVILMSLMVLVTARDIAKLF